MASTIGGGGRPRFLGISPYGALPRRAAFLLDSAAAVELDSALLEARETATSNSRLKHVAAPIIRRLIGRLRNGFWLAAALVDGAALDMRPVPIEAWSAFDGDLGTDFILSSSARLAGAQCRGIRIRPSFPCQLSFASLALGDEDYASRWLQLTHAGKTAEAADVLFESTKRLLTAVAGGAIAATYVGDDGARNEMNAAALAGNRISIDGDTVTIDGTKVLNDVEVILPDPFTPTVTIAKTVEASPRPPETTPPRSSAVSVSGGMECAPEGGQYQAAVLTVCRAC